MTCIPCLQGVGERSGFLDYARIIVISDARRGGSGVHAHHRGGQWSSWKAFQEQAINELIHRRGFSLPLTFSFVSTSHDRCDGPFFYPFSEDKFRLWLLSFDVILEAEAWVNICLSNPLQGAGGARRTREFMAPRRERERRLLPRKMADESSLRGEGGSRPVYPPRPEEWPG